MDIDLRITGNLYLKPRKNPIMVTVKIPKWDYLGDLIGLRYQLFELNPAGFKDYI